MTEHLVEQEKTSRGWCATRWLRFALAITFLTRLPLPIKGDVRPEDLRASMAWYPLIGLALGAAGYGAYTGMNQYLPPTLCAVLVVVLLEMCTGALHLDGFMDTCDGLGSGAPRARALEIMKDSRVGAMGVFGAIAILLIKVAAFAALTTPQSLFPLLAGWAAARSVPVLDLSLFRYARESGTGGLFAGKMPAWVVIIVTVSVCGVAPAVAGIRGLGVVLAVLLVTLLVQSGIARKLGGLTGDVYGLGVELTEALTLVAWCAVL